MLERSSKTELVGKLASSSTYDEAFLACTDGYCIFNAERCLSSYSNKLAKLYPSIRDDLYIGMPYEEYLRLFIQKKAVRNLENVEDVEAWVAAQLNPSELQGAFTHLLHDGRWIQIKFHILAEDQWLFVAFDISHLHQQQKILAASRRKFMQFARLASDWYWELDEQLCYLNFYAADPKNSAVENDQYIGRSRIDVLKEWVKQDDQFHLHISQLRRHETVDVIVEWICEPYENRFTHVKAEPQVDGNGSFQGYIGCGRDVTHEITLQKQLSRMADIDDLTGIANRRCFEQHLQQTITSLHYDWQPKTLVCVDLDKFKQVNDGSGHQAGDALLQFVANEFGKTLGKEAIVARLGGDEFGAIVNLDIDNTYQRIEQFIKKLSNNEFRWKNKRYFVGASAGLTTINDYQSDASELMIQADTACYSAKNSGRSQARIFTHRSTRSFHRKRDDEYLALIVEALESKTLQLSLQPIIPVRDAARQHHFEVLVSFNNGEGRWIAARELIPIAEMNQLNTQVDQFVLTESVQAIKSLRALGVEVHLSVNLSVYSLGDNAFRQWMQEMLAQSDIEPRELGFEFAEKSAFDNVEQLAEFAGELREQGYQVALDDFGNQCSSMDFIRRIPLDYLKIDGQVICEMTQNATSRVMVSTFISLARNLGIGTIAEFVEDRETESLLLRAGVDYVQGFGIAKPAPVEDWLVRFSNDSGSVDNHPDYRRAS